jgi:hypothetical protein
MEAQNYLDDIISIRYREGVWIFTRLVYKLILISEEHESEN